MNRLNRESASPLDRAASVLDHLGIDPYTDDAWVDWIGIEGVTERLRRAVAGAAVTTPRDPGEAAAVAQGASAETVISAREFSL